jgi:protein ImuB
VQSLWRVACVRIPRFPIGAVWRAAQRGETGRPAPGKGSQLPLPLMLPSKSPEAKQGAHASGLTPPPPEVVHWDDMPIALSDATGKRLRAVSAAAGRAGVRAGMRPVQARALCAALIELPWDDMAVTAAITEASALFLAGSPQVTPVEGAPGLWWVGASGFDAVGGERTLAHALLRAARRWHPRPRVAIAGSCVAARAATWAGASFTNGPDDQALVHVVPPNGDAVYLASAPLALVPMDEELRAALQALGLKSVGALAALSAEDVERRWGEIGLRAWRLARADDPRRPVLARVETQPAIEVALSSPAETTEPVLFLVRAALERLVHELASQGRAVAAVAITLTLDDTRGALGSGPVHTVTREARPARPLARVAPLFERCRALLDGWPLTAPVTAVRVAIAATAPLTGEQGDLLSASWRDIGAADAAIERLRAELGTDAIVRAEARDTHRPERAGVWRELSAFDAREVRSNSRERRADSRIVGSSNAPLRAEPFAPRDEQRPQAASGSDHQTIRPKSQRVLSIVSEMSFSSSIPAARRALDPPEPVEVLCEGETPCVVTWRGHRIPVVRALGPERLSGDWWDDGYRRDYWRCESVAGDFTVFIDRSVDEWALQGWGD